MVLAFEGWNDAGEAATSAVQFIDEAAGSEPLAEMDPEIFYDFTVRRPSVVQTADQGRRIEWPRNAFRYGAVDGADLIMGIGVEPHLRWRTYCDAIVGLAADTGTRDVVLLGAYLADVVYSQPVQLTGSASNAKALADRGVVGSAYEGPTGIVGVLAERLECEGLSVTSLWAGLPHYIDVTPNPRGALALVQKVSECLGFGIDDAPLRKRSLEFEQKVSGVVAADAELSEYVRQLKRREFAQ
jgi:proteasome assembly chaperone (PAC2) family protein